MAGEPVFLLVGGLEDDIGSVEPSAVGVAGRDGAGWWPAKARHTSTELMQLADEPGELAVQRVQLPGQLGDAFLDVPHPGLDLVPHPIAPSEHVFDGIERV